MVRPGLLIGVVLLAACVGCFPKAEQLRPDAVWDRLRGANPDAFIVRTMLVEAPAGDDSLTRDAWATAGRPLRHELSALLAQNGLRVGTFTGVLPGDFERLTRTPHATLDAMDRSFTPGKPKVVPVNGPLDHLTYRDRTDLAAEPTPWDFAAVECGFSVTIAAAAGNAVKLTFEPQLQHGDKQLFLKPTADGTAFARDDRKALKGYPALAFDVTLGPKDTLVIGPTADPAETLGGGFFLSAANDRVRQRVLVVRAAKKPAEAVPASGGA
jgi:hypothetical protein